MKEGKLSTDAAYAEIKQVIIPKCYSKLLLDAGEAYRDTVPQLNELLRHLDIKNLSIATVWRWLNYLGYYYDENRQLHYTDGHEREDIVKIGTSTS